jgi:predicted Zn-dependent protease
MLRHLVQIQKALASGHSYLLASQYGLTHACLKHKRISEAIDVFEHVVYGREKELTADQRDLLSFKVALVKAYLDDRRISQAIEIFEHVVYMREKMRVNHPDRPFPQYKLAYSYLKDGRASQAIEILELSTWCK